MDEDVYGDVETVDWIRERKKDRVLRREVQRRAATAGLVVTLWNAVQSWLLMCGIGAGIGLLAGVTDVATAWLLDLREGSCTGHFYVSRAVCCWQALEQESCQGWTPWSSSPVVHFLVFTLLSAALAATSVVLVMGYFADGSASGSGFEEVRCILGGFAMRNVLGGHMLLVKTVSLCLAVGSGLYVGKEELLVHLACCIGCVLMAQIPRYAASGSRFREILSVCSATAVSVAFGAPVGGVLFALEDISYFFPYRTMFRSFFCAMVGSIVLKMVNPYRTGRTVVFAVEYVRDWLGFELPIFILLGVLGGLFGATYGRLTRRWQRFRERFGFQRHPVWEVVAISLFTSAIGVLHPLFRLSSARMVSVLFQECIDNDLDGICTTNGAYASHFLMVLLSALFRVVLPLVTCASSIPGGIFVPAMAVGGCFGRAIGILLQMLQAKFPTALLFSECPPGQVCITPSKYAIVGAAAALGGVTKSTVSLAVIMFELTGALSYMLPIMISAIMARWVHSIVAPWGGDDTGGGSAVEKRKKLPYLHKDLLYSDDADETISSKMTKFEELVVIVDGSYSETLADIVNKTEYRMYPVIEPEDDDNDRRLKGKGKGKLKRHNKDTLLADVDSDVETNNGALSPHFPCGGLSGKFIGFVYRDDLVAFLESEVSEEGNEPTRRVWFSDEAVEENLQHHVNNINGNNGGNTEDIGEEQQHLPVSTNTTVVDGVRFHGFVDRSPIRVGGEMAMGLAANLFKVTGCHTVAVLEGGFLRGLMTRKDVIRLIS